MGGMGGVDNADDDDDLEVEVSDLRRAPVADTPRAGQRTAGGAHAGARERADGRGAEREAIRVAAASAAAEAHGTPAAVEGEGAGTPVERSGEGTMRRRAGRLFTARRTRGYVVAGLTLLVCAGLLLSLPGTQQVLRQALVSATPTPSAPLAPGEDHIYFEQSAPWGRLTLDGRRVDLPPQVFQDMSLLRGRHTLSYVAAPWAPLRCQLSVPAQPDDTCPRDSQFSFGSEPLARVIALGATPERLPAAQRAALTSAVARALQATVETTAVAPGDHYRGADGQIAVATTPLQASLLLTLNTDATRAASNTAAVPGPGGPCVSLCAEPGGGGGGATWWVAWAHVIARWRFVAADGTRIDPGSGADLDAGYPVGATWSASGGISGEWSVTTHPYPGAPGDQGFVCDSAFQQAFPNGNPLPSASGFSSTLYYGTSADGGCVEVISPSSSSAGGGSSVTTTSPSPTPLPAGTAIFIVRFGMVLAGNDAAHTAQPLFPVASAHERALAQQWMTQPP